MTDVAITRRARARCWHQAGCARLELAYPGGLGIEYVSIDRAAREGFRACKHCHEPATAAGEGRGNPR